MAKRRAGKKGKGGVGGLIAVGVFALIAAAGAGGRGDSSTARTSTPRPRPTSTSAQVAQQPEATATKILFATATRAATMPVHQPVTSPVAREFTATGNANVRECPELDCAVVETLTLGQRLTMIDVAQGDEYNGSTTWYELRLSGGITGFVHSAFAREGTPRPAAQPVQPRATSVPNTQGGGSTVATDVAPSSVIPTDVPPTEVPFAPNTSTPPGPQSPFGCNGADDLNCSDFRAIGQSANAHLAACGDEDNLDADGDGRACER